MRSSIVKLYKMRDSAIIFGTALAITISYAKDQSIIWAIVHGLCGWLYVIYAALYP